MAGVTKSNPMRQSTTPVAHSVHPSHNGDDGIHLNPAHKGLLHKRLGVKSGQPIPSAKLRKALHSSSPVERKEAQFATNFSH